MIKIIHLITGLGLGGAENQLAQLVRHSDPSRCEHIIISMQDTGIYGAKLREQGIKLYTLGMRRGSISIIACYRLIKILQQEKPDLLQTWLYHADLLGLLVGKFLGFSNIIWNIRCSNMDLKHYSRLTSLVIKFCSFFSFIPKAVIVNSSAGQVAHEALGYRVKNWIKIPNGFNTDHYKPDPAKRIRLRDQLTIQNSSLLVGMIARYDPMKDHVTFLQAVKKMLPKFNDIQFVLVGEGINKSNKPLMEKIVSLELESYIHLLGARQDIPDILNALDVLVLPSAFGEGFPNILGEAMASGIPCIASRVGDSAAIIDNTGIVVQPSNPEQLANAIEALLQLDKIERQRLGELARSRIIENYQFSKVIKKYETIYEELCAE